MKKSTKMKTLLGFLFLIVLIGFTESSSHTFPRLTNINSTIPTVAYVSESQTAAEVVFTATGFDSSDPFIFYMGAVTPATGVFSVNSNGDIMVAANPGFDMSVADNYTIEVCVKEVADATHFACDFIRIDVLAATPPVWANLDFTLNLQENEPVGSRVYTIRATDADFDTVYYSLIGVTPGGPFPFDFANNTGAVTLTSALDYETQTTYTMTFTATDAIFREITGTLTINIVNVNEPVTMTGYPGNVAVEENYITAGQEVLFTLTGNDPEGLPVTWGLTCEPTTVACPFGVDASGNVYVDSSMGMLEYETVPLFNVTLTATDGTTTATHSMNFYIIDINESPVITNLPNAVDVLEDEQVGREIFTVTSTDPENDSRQYFIGVEPDHQESFSIDQNSGVISINNNPNFDNENRAFYTVHVFVHDGHTAAPIGDLIVNIVDVNDSPVIHNLPANWSFYEGVTDVSEVFHVYATDDDVPAGDTITYSIGNVWPVIGGSQFTIDPVTGKLKTVNNPGFDTNQWPNYQIDIIATDTSMATDVKRLYIDMRDSNNRPRFIVPAVTAYVDEAGTIGATIPSILLAATDPDLTDILTYTLTGTGSGDFTVDNTGGTPLLKYNGVVDYDTMALPAVYHLNVRVSDPSGSSDQLPMNLIINNLNDQTPTFPSAVYTVSVLENAPIGTSVANIMAVDADLDPYGDFVYEIDPFVPQAVKHFEISPVDGVLYVKIPVDYEEYTFISFNVKATDDGGLWSTSRVDLTVLDENDNYPTFLPLGIQLYNMEIPSDADSGAAIGFVEAADLDSGSPAMTYSLLDDDDGNFKVDSVTGLITLATSSLVENTTYKVMAQAEDPTPPNAKSDAIAVRIDAYRACSTVYNLYLSATPSTFTSLTARTQFTAKLKDVISGSLPRLAYIEDQWPDNYDGTSAVSGQVKMSVYIVKGTTTDQLWALGRVNKTYYHANTLDGFWNSGDGTPSVSLTTIMGTAYTVTKVEPYDTAYCYVPVPYNWWLDTTPGRALTAVLSMVLIGLLATLAVYLCKKIPWHKLPCLKKKPPKPQKLEPKRPATPGGGDTVHDFQYESNKLENDPFTFRRGGNKPIAVAQ